MAEGTSDVVEVPSDQESGSDPNDNFEQTTSESLQSIHPLSYLYLIG